MRVNTVRFRTAIVAMVMAAGLSACAVGHALPAPPPPGSVHARQANATSTRKLPGAYLGAMAGQWAGPKIRPRYFDLGADWSVYLLKWAGWGQDAADGHGRYIESAGAGCPCTRYWATIALTHVKDHDGIRYFATMKITGEHRKALWLVMNTSLGWWREK
jgi:hypothetical protein